jgi:tetratricopeptide (TPR) repeat protein
LTVLRSSRLRHAVVIAALLACIAGSQALLDPYRALVNDESGVQFSMAAVVVRSFMGQVRGLLADFLWLRVDEYQHRRRIVGGELLKGDDEALMPLVRLITWLNPHFIEAYALGGQWLAFHFDQAGQATAFYEEGIRNNPESFDLLNGAAWVYWRLRHDYPSAEKRALEAARVAPDDLHRFQALWLDAHILMTAGDTAGAIRAWRAVGEIPGYAETARIWIKRVQESSTKPAP